ncbi:hypothetical protein [Winogradskyella sp. SYSU M77433]|uniref:hypothetical protein n=1 Tax=Winogradskyella sp. SYSU M77433 TaxID=3042722 RepID=UPI002480C10E|nr:hypothetical protein [Winogradskyella sp. SYSU M77433]MDH7913979.1 hypothetical protein [Winogradskyella sp. SYSU M77433]
MRTDNRKVRNTVISIYFVLILLTVLMATVFSSLELVENGVFYVFLGFLVLLVLVQSIAGYFEYDSDGDKIIVINKGLILTEYINYRQKKIKFKRNQLVGFKIKNYFFYKSLVLQIKTHEDRVVKYRFNVTLLKPKKIRYVKQSLRKIFKERKISKLG